MDRENFWVVALTALLLNLTPGNDMIYVASRSKLLTTVGIKVTLTKHS